MANQQPGGVTSKTYCQSIRFCNVSSLGKSFSANRYTNQGVRNDGIDLIATPIPIRASNASTLIGLDLSLVFSTSSQR